MSREDNEDILRMYTDLRARDGSFNRAIVDGLKMQPTIGGRDGVLTV